MRATNSPPKEFVELLLRWPGSLVARSLRNPEGIAKLWRESLLFLPHIEGETLADLGSGAGFPGLPIKLARPHMRVYLIERSHKKASFLREIKRRLGIKGLFVFWGSWDDVDLAVDCAVSRAAGPVPTETLAHILRPGGCYITCAPGDGGLSLKKIRI